MTTKDLTGIKELLQQNQEIVIIPHRNPDGDAYGSCLALYKYLKDAGQNVNVVSPNDCPNFLKWLPGEDQIVVFERSKEQATELLNNATLVFTLDFNSFSRVGNEMQSVLEQIKPIYIMIDHHQQPDDYAKYSFVDVTNSSTCQMVFEFLEMLEVTDKIDQDIATCLYTGILTDTGSFRFPSTSSKTHMIAAELLAKGVQHADIYNKIFENSLGRLHLLGKALQKIVVLEKYKTAYITLTNQELRKFNYKKGDTEGFVNYALSLENVVLAVIFIEDKQQRIIKISFRSIGDFNVNVLARENFSGGGHINAAGGRSELTLKETVEKFVSILPDYQVSLNS